MTELKKTYAKPEMEYVDFALASSIAANCGSIINSQDGNSCERTDTDGWGAIFTNPNDDCAIKSDEEKFCYHVPNDDGTLFTS